MTSSLDIRKSVPGDVTAIETLYPEAFPDEDLLPLVKTLLQDEASVLSLVGMMDLSVVGHVMFTRCSLDGTHDDVSLLGPLAVAPACQQQGIGSAIVRAGLENQKNAGVTQVYVLGDPAYYGRFGFLPELNVMPPYPLPAEWQGAWQSLPLKRAEPPRQGQLSVPDAWRQRALWGP